MAEGFKHPKSKVHVGDGFKFLEDYKNEFDVIITDSSDPEGPAESLFQKPYFELLFGALKEGGVITTQGCRFPLLLFLHLTSKKLGAIFMTWGDSPLTIFHPVLQRLIHLLLLSILFVLLALSLIQDTPSLTGRQIHVTNPFHCPTAENQWLHLKLITELKKSCREVFPVVEYAYTTIPTYPSGQIGFMVCTKDATRNVKKPVRTQTDEEEQKLFRYYNKHIHEASFVLPTFAALALK
jgi:spermidine synthase